MTSVPPARRAYQSRVVDLVGAGHNVLVMLPTGAGKTRAAAEAIATHGRVPCLFLVPSVELLDQQAKALREVFAAHGKAHYQVETLHGGKNTFHGTFDPRELVLNPLRGSLGETELLKVPRQTAQHRLAER